MNDINFYLKFAEKVTSTYIAKTKTPLKLTDELVGEVASKMMKSHTQFDYSKVNDQCKKDLSYEQIEQNFLKICAILYLKQKNKRLCEKKNKTVFMSDISDNFAYTIYDRPEVDNNSKTRDDIIRLMELSGMNKKDRDLINQYMDGIPVKEIAKQLNVSNTRIYARLNNITETLHCMANH